MSSLPLFVANPSAFAIIVLAVNILILVVFIMASSSFFKRLILSQEEKARIREEAEREAKLIRGRAQNDALRMAEEAHRKAEEVLREMRIFGEDERRALNQGLAHFLDREGGRLRSAGEDRKSVV